jgi:hypothetical protein
MKHPAILLLLVLTSGCAVNTTPQMWSIFEDMCSANGGIKFAFVALSRRELVCNNGALFDARDIKVWKKNRLKTP